MSSRRDKRQGRSEVTPQKPRSKKVMYVLIGLRVAGYLAELDCVLWKFNVR
jgi:hypothetical protein